MERGVDELWRVGVVEGAGPQMGGADGRASQEGEAGAERSDRPKSNQITPHTSE